MIINPIQLPKISKYVFIYAGCNIRLDEIHVVNVKLKHLDEDIEFRQQVAAYYYDNIKIH